MTDKKRKTRSKPTTSRVSEAGEKSGGERPDTGNSRDVLIFRAWLVLAFAVGAFLRLYLLADQILLDDEWHGLWYAIWHSTVYMFTHADADATCVPLNIYSRLLLHFIGWSEFLVRLPSVAAGMLALALFPMLVSRAFNRRTTVIFAFLFAISPFLVFYARNSRPYSIVTLLGFLAIMSLYLWAVDGEQRGAWVFVVTSALATFHHLFAVVGVFTPWVCVVLLKAVQLRTGKPWRGRQILQIVPSCRALVAAGLCAGALTLLLVLPSKLGGSLGTTLNADRIDLETLFRAARMLAGTHYTCVAALFWALFAAGLLATARRSPLFCMFVATIALVGSAVLAVTGPACIDAPIVFLRYMIFVFPLVFILVACGLDRAMMLIEHALPAPLRDHSACVSGTVCAGFLGALLFAGPLIRTYKPPNNFTNHSAFQETYRPRPRHQSYRSDMVDNNVLVKQAELSPLFARLGGMADVDSIVEYPMDYSDHRNFAYYYQQVHRKRVIAGYVSEPDLVCYHCWRDLEVVENGVRRIKRTKCSLSGISTLDFVLTRVKDHSRLQFRNLVDVSDIDTVRQTGAQIIVLHKRIRYPVDPGQKPEDGIVYFDAVPRLAQEYYRPEFGPPLYEDEFLIAFDLRRRASDAGW